MYHPLTCYCRRLEKKGYENFIPSDYIEISQPEMGYNSAAVGKFGSNFPLPPSRKESFIYDDQNKDFHRFVTLVPGGHVDPLSYYRGNPHLRFASEATMVQKCCGGDLWRNRVGRAR